MMCAMLGSNVSMVMDCTGALLPDTRVPKATSSSMPEQWSTTSPHAPKLIAGMVTEDHTTLVEWEA